MDLLFCLQRFIRVSTFIQLTKLRAFPSVYHRETYDSHGWWHLDASLSIEFSQTRYWSFPKFLSRGKWDADAIAAHLIRRIQQVFENSSMSMMKLMP